MDPEAGLEQVVDEGRAVLEDRLEDGATVVGLSEKMRRELHENLLGGNAAATNATLRRRHPQ
jgi:hypothetical protein